jgi:hypothetical protein
MLFPGHRVLRFKTGHLALRTGSSRQGNLDKRPAPKRPAKPAPQGSLGRPARSTGSGDRTPTATGPLTHTQTGTRSFGQILPLWYRSGFAARKSYDGCLPASLRSRLPPTSHSTRSGPVDEAKDRLLEPCRPACEVPVGFVAASRRSFMTALRTSGTRGSGGRSGGLVLGCAGG